MSEQAPNTNEQESKSANPYEGLDNATLAAIAEARNSIDEGSATKTLDLRSKVREILENSGVDGAFKRAYNMNNGELNTFVDGAAAEQTGRRVAEVQSIIDAYDSSDSFADRRTAIREALIAAGHEDAFKQIYNMNNLELTSFVEAARAEHQELTTPSESEALEVAYDEYEKQEGTPYDVDKDRVKDSELARDMAVDEQNISKVGEFIRNNPESPETQRLINELKDIMRQINEALNAARTPEKDDLNDLEDLSTPAANLDDLEDVPRARSGEDDLSDLEDLPTSTADNLDDLDDIDTPQSPDDAHDDDADGDHEEGGDSHEEDEGETERVREKWYKRAWNRLQYTFTPQGRQEMLDRAGNMKDKYKDSKTSTKIAIGVVAATAVTIAAYGAWKAGAFDMFSGDNTPDSTPDTDAMPEVTPEVKPEIKPETPPVTPEAFDFSDAARTVESGEGWFQTMNEAGITNAAQQAELLKNDELMNQLKDMGLAYRAPDLGGWGINMPSDGVMPQEALDLIKNASK